jgi:hypothetical protein
MRELNSYATHATGATVNENALTCLELSSLKESLVCGQPADL